MRIRTATQHRALAMPKERWKQPSFWERVRWSFGWVRPADLHKRTDSELIGLADRWAKAGRARRAAKVLQAFSVRSTRDPRILQQYGDVSRSIGSHQAAIESYLGAAELYRSDGMLQKAVSLLAQVVRLYPEHVDAQLFLGRTQEAIGRYKEAANAYSTAGRLLEQRGDLERGAELSARAVQLCPSPSGRASQPPSGRGSIQAVPLDPARPSTTPPPSNAASSRLTPAVPARRSLTSAERGTGLPAPTKEAVAMPGGLPTPKPAKRVLEDDALELDLELGASVRPQEPIGASEETAPDPDQGMDTILMLSAVEAPLDPLVERPRFALDPSLRYAGDAPTRMYSEADAAPTLMESFASPLGIEPAASIVVELHIPTNDTDPEAAPDEGQPDLHHRRRS